MSPEQPGRAGMAPSSRLPALQRRVSEPRGSSGTEDSNDNDRKQQEDGVTRAPKTAPDSSGTGLEIEKKHAGFPATQDHKYLDNSSETSLIPYAPQEAGQSADGGVHEGGAHDSTETETDASSTYVQSRRRDLGREYGRRR